MLHRFFGFNLSILRITVIIAFDFAHYISVNVNCQIYKMKVFVYIAQWHLSKNGISLDFRLFFLFPAFKIMRNFVGMLKISAFFMVVVQKGGKILTFLDKKGYLNIYSIYNS